MTMGAAELAARIDHTLLRPEATRDDVERAAVQAIELGCASVCVQPDQVAFVREVVGDRIVVCSVVVPTRVMATGVSGERPASMSPRAASPIRATADSSTRVC